MSTPASIVVVTDRTSIPEGNLGSSVRRLGKRPPAVDADAGAAVPVAPAAAVAFPQLARGLGELAAFELDDPALAHLAALGKCVARPTCERVAVEAPPALDRPQPGM